MTDFARGLGPLPLAHSSARNRPGIVRPSRPSPPTFNKCRRVTRVSWKPQQAKEYFCWFMLNLCEHVSYACPTEVKALFKLLQAVATTEIAVGTIQNLVSPTRLSHTETQL